MPDPRGALYREHGFAGDRLAARPARDPRAAHIVLEDPPALDVRRRGCRRGAIAVVLPFPWLFRRPRTAGSGSERGRAGTRNLFHRFRPAIQDAGGGQFLGRRAMPLSVPTAT